MDLISRFKYYLILICVVIIFTVLYPEGKGVQIATPIAVWIIMLILNRITRAPVVEISDYVEDLICINGTTYLSFEFKCNVVNKSFNGCGDLIDIILSIETDKEKVDLSFEKWGNYNGFRFEPNSKLPVDIICFHTNKVHLVGNDVIGKPSKVIVSVVGQKDKQYPVNIIGEKGVDYSRLRPFTNFYCSA